MKRDEAESAYTEDVHSGSVSASCATVGYVKVLVAFRSRDFTRIPFGSIGLINNRSCVALEKKFSAFNYSYNARSARRLFKDVLDR